MTPEEKLAVKFLERHRLTPPYNLKELASLYAEVEFLPFPENINADGISLGLKQLSKPKIYINSSRPTSRQNFTLAHELGHVIIPWHIGNIVSHTDIKDTEDNSSSNSDNSDDYEYRLIESEANRFAAELLIPTFWLSNKVLNLDISNIENILNKIANDSGTSKQAVLIKLFKALPSGYTCAEIDDNGIVVNGFMSENTIVYKPKIGTKYYGSEIYSIYKDKKTFSLNNKNYIIWTFEKDIQVPDETDRRPWREILEIILNDLNLQAKKTSISSILSSAMQSNKDKADSEIISIIYHRYSDHKDLNGFIEHPLCDQYIVKRFKELQRKWR